MDREFREEIKEISFPNDRIKIKEKAMEKYKINKEFLENPEIKSLLKYFGNIDPIFLYFGYLSNRELIKIFERSARFIKPKYKIKEK